MASEAAFTVRNYTDAGSAPVTPALDDLYVFAGPSKVSLVQAKRSEGSIRSLRSIESPKGAFASTAEVEAALAELQVQKEYASLSTVIMNDTHAFVPEPLFVGEKAASYLRATHSVPASHSLLFNRISQRNLVSVYALTSLVHDAIRSAWPESPLVHRNELFLSLVQEQGEDQSVFLNIREASFDMCWMQNGSIGYFNTFPYEAETDIIYFVLSVMDDQKLDVAKTRIVMCGDVSANGALPGLMKKYIPLSVFMKRPAGLRYPASFREFAEHQHLIEISCLLCE